jgi:hypothetical protein
MICIACGSIMVQYELRFGYFNDWFRAPWLRLVWVWLLKECRNFSFLGIHCDLAIWLKSFLSCFISLKLFPSPNYLLFLGLEIRYLTLLCSCNLINLPFLSWCSSLLSGVACWCIGLRSFYNLTHSLLLLCLIDRRRWVRYVFIDFLSNLMALIFCWYGLTYCLEWTKSLISPSLLSFGCT